MSGGTIGTNQSICWGETPAGLTNEVNPSGGNGSFSYIWQKSPNGSTGWVDVAGASSVSFSPEALTVSTFYRRKASNLCGDVFSNVVSITVSAQMNGGLITTTSGNSLSICNGTVPPQITNVQSATGGSGTYSYQWQKNDSGEWSDIVGAIGNQYTSLALSKSTSFRRRATNGCGMVYSNSIDVLVTNPLVSGAIGTDQQICYNETPSGLTNLTLPSGGQGNSFTYQWQQSVNGTGGWSNITNANGEFFNPPALTSSLYYRRQEINSCGIVYSNSVFIEVAQSLNAGVISGTQSICYGNVPEPILSSSAASGGFGEYFYQWEASSNGVSGWLNLLGQTGPSLTFSELLSTTYFRRKVVNSCGTLYSNIVQITVSSPLFGGDIGMNQSVCYGSNANEITQISSPVGGFGPYTFSWEYVVLPNNDWLVVPGATGSTLTPSNMFSTTIFRRKLLNQCGVAYSNEVTITVREPITPGVVSGDQEICYGTSASSINNLLNPMGGFGPFTYVWQSSSNGVNGWVDIETAVNASYGPGVLFATKHFRRKEFNDCGVTYSNVSKVSVAEDVLAGQINGSESICFGNQASEIQNVMFPQGGIGIFGYSWEFSLNGSSWNTIAEETQANYNPIGLSSNRFFRRKETNNCKTVYSNTVQKIFLTEFKPGSVGGNQTINFGETPSLLSTIIPPSGGLGSYQIQWQYQDNGIDWINVLGATQSSYQPASLFTTTKFRKRVIDGQCGQQYSNELVVQVTNDLVPGSIGENQTICFSTRPNILSSLADPSGGNGAIQIFWEQSINGTQWSTIPGQVGTTYHPGVLTQNTYFRRKVQSGSLSKFSNEVLIVVRAEVVQPIINGGGTYCKGSSVQMAVQSPMLGIVYEWYDQGGSNLHTGNTYNLTNVLNNITLFVKGKDDNGCYSSAGSSIVQVDPISANFTQSHSSVTEGGMVQFYSTSINASIYEWFFGFGETFNEQNPYIYYNQPGIYPTHLKVWSNLGCFSEKIVSNSVTVNTINSVEDNEVKVYLYPNPTLGLITIESDLGIESLEIVSTTGVLHINKSFSAGTSVSINLSETLSKGLYLVKVYGRGYVSTFKVILL
jgi:hypothetical protein